MAALTALIFTAFSQTKVYPLSEVNPKETKGECFAYMLPTTMLKVTVTEVKVTEVKGYYSDYAESLLGLTNFIKENKTRYELGGVKIETVSTGDPGKSFLVVGKNTSSVRKLFEKDTHSGNDASTGSTVYSSKASALPEFFRNYADLSYTQQSQAFVETKIIDGVVTQVPANHTKVVSKSFEQKARQAADAIAKCRDDQYLLATGEHETPYSGEALRTMLDELKSWENNYMSLFTGVTLRDTVCRTFYVTPADMQNEVAVFSFSTDKGIAEKTSKGDTYSLKFNNFSNTSSISEAISQITATADTSNYLRIRKSVPVQTLLMLNGKEVYDFGFIDMFQFADIQLIPCSNANCGHGIEGFIY